MKYFTLLVLIFALQAHAQDLRYRTIQELTSAGQIQLTCKSTQTDPQTNTSFRFGFGSTLPDSLSIAVIWPNEGMWVREVKTDATYPVWNRDFGTGDYVSFTGNSIPTNEFATIKIEQSTGGRFKTTMFYLNRITGERIEISNLRCYATNFTRRLGE